MRISNDSAMNQLLIIAALGAILSIVSIHGLNVQRDETALRSVSSGMNRFATDFYQILAESERGNFVTSPLSVSMVMSMLLFGARGTTEQQLRSALNLPNDEMLTKDGLKALVHSLNNIKKVELSLANKIFMNNGLKLEEHFRNVMEDIFKSAVESIDFSKTAEAANTINNWAATNTNNRIKDLFKPNELRGAITVLANAVYFKGNWKKPFSKALTQPRDFHVNGQTVKKVDMMRIQSNFYWGKMEDMRATYVEIPYESQNMNDQMSMFVIIPDAIDGLPMVERNLHRMNFAELNGRTSKVELFLPKFKAESKFYLQHVLSRMGMDDMFKNSANFEGLTNGSMHISEVIQKAYINVDEKGTEAAAATGGGMVGAFPKPPEPITTIMANRPFVYAIVHGNANTVIFQGRVMSPAM